MPRHSAVGTADSRRRPDGRATGETGSDEFAELSASVNQMQKQLQELLQRISATSGELAEASERISQGTSHSAETSRQQTDQTNMVATAIQRCRPR